MSDKKKKKVDKQNDRSRIWAALGEVRRRADEKARGLFVQQLQQWTEEDAVADPKPAVETPQDQDEE